MPSMDPMSGRKLCLLDMCDRKIFVISGPVMHKTSKNSRGPSRKIKCLLNLGNIEHALGMSRRENLWLLHSSHQNSKINISLKFQFNLTIFD